MNSISRHCEINTGFSFFKETVETLSNLASDAEEKRLSREEMSDGRAAGWP